ncbi:MAG: hypothetical protein AAF849_16275 [Bacteroidota bacterium]
MAEKKKFKGHGNRNDNTEPHHLYEIIDSVDGDTFKYGISAEPIEKDGYSKRMRKQVTLGNLFVGWIRFFARILVKNISGRKEAKQLEKEHIDKYEKERGRKPRGNQE